MYPIIFSMVVGRAVYKLASWKLERGASVGELEQLLGSRTVTSTITTQFMLWPGAFMGAGLLVLWLLSPVGSQACVRILKTQQLTATTATTATYFNTRQGSVAGTGYGSWLSIYMTLFSAALIAPLEVKAGPMDLWGNVKIPYFSSMEDVAMNQDGWRNVPVAEMSLEYSSLFGVPVSGLTNGNTTFTIESTYVELACSDRSTEVVRGDNRAGSFMDPGLISINGPFIAANNVTSNMNWAVGYQGEDVTSLLPTEVGPVYPCLSCLPQNVSETKFSGKILFQDFSGAKNATSIYCTPSQVYVESKVLCSSSDTSKSCMVTAQRESRLPHAPNTITLLAFRDLAMSLSKYLPQSTPPSSGLDMMLNYLVKPRDIVYVQSTLHPYLQASVDDQESSIQNISLKGFEVNLGQVLNAYLFGSIFNATEYLTSGNFNILDISKLKADEEISQSPTILYEMMTAGKSTFAVAASQSTNTTVFAISVPWLSFLLLANSAMLLAALFSAYLTCKTRLPSYLGFVSTLVRESEYVRSDSKTAGGQGGGVQLNGLERTQEMMKHGVRIKLGDVGEVEGGFEIGTGVEVRVGRIGFADFDGVRELERDRLYV